MGSSKNKTLMLSWRNRQNWRSIGARSRLPYPSGSSEIPSQDYSTDSAYSVDGDASSSDILPKSLPTSPPSSPPTAANEAIPESVQKFEIPRKSGNRRKSIKDLRKIRDKDRECRRTSVVPDVGFIVEEGLLEDLCEISGEEAKNGGNILMHDEKTELLKRLRKNSETAAVFRNSTSYKTFQVEAGKATTAAQRRSTVHKVKNNAADLSEESLTNAKSPLTVRLSRNSKTSENPLSSRRRSISDVKSSQKNNERMKIHALTTEVNYYTEMEAMKMASKNDHCFRLKNCLFRYCWFDCY